ncbi:MAG: 6-phosphogluconolactonase [Sphingomonadaceae bacterium]
MIQRNLIVKPNLQRLSEAAAGLFAELAADAIARRGRFAVALSGGSTPKRLYQLLANAPWREQIDWGRCHLFWGDERLVPADHPDSNYRLARETLLRRLPIPLGQIHRVPVEVGVGESVAAAYEAEMRRFFVEDTARQHPHADEERAAGDEAAPGDSEPRHLSGGSAETPRFDLVLLGLGSDGHTASLFPGHSAVEEQVRWVVATPSGRLPPPVDRVTLTLPVINAARAVLFLVAGADKAPVLRQVLAGEASLPASLVRPSDGELYWLVDEAAL